MDTLCEKLKEIKADGIMNLKVQYKPGNISPYSNALSSVVEGGEIIITGMAFKRK